mmetsp:Transcript_4820/g.9533  ORF Transcript_4820/g.9533 Transcript_4820/m.9533 type:complete len:243 (+) Transcript_4820:797-1525(+)
MGGEAAAAQGGESKARGRSASSQRCAAGESHPAQRHDRGKLLCFDAPSSPRCPLHHQSRHPSALARPCGAAVHQLLLRRRPPHRGEAHDEVRLPHRLSPAHSPLLQQNRHAHRVPRLHQARHHQRLHPGRHCRRPGCSRASQAAAHEGDRGGEGGEGAEGREAAPRERERGGATHTQAAGRAVRRNGEVVTEAATRSMRGRWCRTPTREARVGGEVQAGPRPRARGFARAGARAGEHAGQDR